MSIALNRGLDSGFGLADRPSFFDSPENDPGDGGEAPNSSESSSSIGKNSDVSLDGDCEENEVQSSYKGGPLDMMDALEEVLPIRKGISNYYDGKSRSYTSLVDASASSTVKEISKPENAYNRRRRNLLAFHQVWEKNGNSLLRGGISKRPLSSCKSTLALAVAMCNSESFSSTTSEESSSGSVSPSPPPPPPPLPLPPIHPQVRGCLMSPRKMFSPWKSFSVSDLQHCSNPPTTRVVRFDESISEKPELEELI